MGGRLGILSCYEADGTQALECNTTMAANALAHGVPWGVIEGFSNYTKPSDMMWISAEAAECWGMMRWSAQDTSNDGLACYVYAMLTNTNRKPEDVGSQRATDILCRMNAGTSLIFISTGQKEQGFSDAYQKACERIAADPATPKYSAIDIILWLTLTDPKIRAMKPGTILSHILSGDENQAKNCWKCLTIMGISEALNGFPNDALTPLRDAVNVVKRDTGSVPRWLTSRVEIIAAEAAKNAH